MGRKIILNGKEYIGGGEDVSGIVDSLNTTEQTPRNIADVLAEELARIAGAITNAENIENILTDMTTTKDATLTSGVADFKTIDGNLVKSLVVEIEPSTTGYTQADVYVVGKNLLNCVNPQTINGYISNLGGGIGRITANNQNKGVVIPVQPNTDYAYVWNRVATTSSNDDTGIIVFDEYPISGVTQGRLIVAYQSTSEPILFTTGDSAKYVFIKIANINNTNFQSTLEASQLEENSTATAYEPYKGKTYTTNFGQNITAGGTLNFLTGELTTGGSTISLTPQTVKALVGENHIMASTGDVTECKFSMLINGDDLEMLLS